VVEALVDSRVTEVGGRSLYASPAYADSHSHEFAPERRARTTAT
jgi:hypothetical protein